ncbi:M56 family metallopeptidase [Kitasatospora sp. NPDC097691]|uniref:M56 family metallopeptidase n=1 Tax=Kitasatospora sp. NPDC097691 TaxID=3157231 RepID=UPI0033188A96
MMIAVWAPLLLPFLAAPLARRLAEALPPRAAAWTLVGSTAVLAGGTVCSLGLLATAGLLQLPPVAALGHLSLRWLTAAAPDAPLAAAAAALALVALTVLAVRTARRRRLELRTARAALPPGDRHPDVRPRGATMRRARTPERFTAPAPGPAEPCATTPALRTEPCAAAGSRPAGSTLAALLRPTEPPLSVLDDECADAFALPGRLRRPGRPGEPGRIVVTSGMLRALSGPERSALLAHERAHLAARHHVFLAMAEHAAHVHPALRALRAPLGYHLERWADEVAATRVGDRTVTARAVGRAALAASRSPWPDRPRTAPAAHSGPVPRRVAALLQPRPAATPGARLRAVALALAACLALSTGATLEATADLHHTVEVAQLGTGAHH